MPETNFLSLNQEKEKKSGKKRPKRIARNSSPEPRLSSDRPASAAKEAALETKMEIEKKSVVGKKNGSPVRLSTLAHAGQPAGEAKNDHSVGNNISNSVYRKIAFSFVALTIILVAAVLYFGLAKVTLIIIPTQEKVADSLSLEIIGRDGSQTVGPGQVLGLVKQVPMEQARTFTASGREVLGEEVSGKVTIINNYIKNQPLVATTRLLGPNNKLFRLKNTVNVPAGAKIEAEVYADEPKPEMTIGPSKFIIPGLWAGIQDKIYAQSQAPMKYSQKIKRTIIQSDIDNAVSEFKKDLLAKAKKEIGAGYPQYDRLLFQIDNNSVKLEALGKVGEEKENFTIKMKTLVTVVALKNKDIYDQAEQRLTATLADDREIVELSRPDMVFVLGKVNLSQAAATVNVNFTAKITLKDSAKIIKKNNLTGLNAEQVKAHLNSLPEVAGYEIKFFPSFMKKMPDLVDRIEIVIKRK